MGRSYPKASRVCPFSLSVKPWQYWRQGVHMPDVSPPGSPVFQYLFVSSGPCPPWIPVCASMRPCTLPPQRYGALVGVPTHRRSSRRLSRRSSTQRSYCGQRSSRATRIRRGASAGPTCPFRHWTRDSSGSLRQLHSRIRARSLFPPKLRAKGGAQSAGPRPGRDAWLQIVLRA